MTAQEMANSIWTDISGPPSDPHILFIGEGFDCSDEKSCCILKLKWSLILTTRRDDEILTQVTNSLPSHRQVREMWEMSPDDYIKSSSKNLKLIRLFSKDEPGTLLERKKAQTYAADIIKNIWRKTLKHGGQFVAVGYCEDGALSYEKMSDILISCAQTEDSAIFYGVGDELQAELDALGADLRQEDLGYDVLHSFRESLGALLYERIAAEEGDEDEDAYDTFSHTYGNKLKFFINNEPCVLDRASIVGISDFATLLNEEELNKVYVPPQYVDSFFSQFLEKSASTPEWYGYKEGFNLLRDYEEELLEKAQSGLKSPGVMDDESAPICLTGESGSGKSVAAANLAYRIYRKKQYPVVYLNSRSLHIFEKYPEKLEALNGVLELLQKELNARCVLVVWDISMFESDVAQFIKIHSKLRSTWLRSIQFVITAYENIDIDKNTELQFVKAPIALSTTPPEGKDRSELDRLQTILKRKARWNADEIRDTMEALRGSEDVRKSFMVTLHKLFIDTRSNIQESMRNYMSRSLDNAFENDKFSLKVHKTSFQKAMEQAERKMREKGVIRDSDSPGGADNKAARDELKAKIENLLKITAICSKFGLTVPYDMVMRLTGLFDERIKEVFSLFAYVEYDENDLGDYSIRFRTRYEADIYLQSISMNRSEQLQAIVDLIRNMKASNDLGSYQSNAELSLVVDLLSRVGPNSKDFLSYANRLSIDDYPEIIGALEEYRDNEGIIPVLVVQEVSYTREYCVESLKLKKLTHEAAAGKLAEAIRLCTAAIDLEKRVPYSRAIRNLVVEKASCTSRRLELDYPSKRLDVADYETMLDELNLARQISPGDPYVITSTLWFMARAYDNLPDTEGGRQRRAEIEKSAPDFIDSIACEYADVAQDNNFTMPAEHILEKIDQTLSDEYIDSLIADGNPSGYYLKAYKKLKEAGLDKNRGPSPFSGDEAARCAAICKEVFSTPEAQPVVAQDIRCQRLVLRLKWISYNKQEIFGEDDQLTRMTNDQWAEVNTLCERYQQCTLETLTFFYMRALSCLQLKDYHSFGTAIKDIRTATEYQEFRGNNRVRVRHIVCDEKGNPRLFNGKFNSNMLPSIYKGNFVDITEIDRKDNVNRDVYFNSKNIKLPTEYERGQSYSDWQLGLGYMGLSAFRGLKGKAGDSRG